MIQIEQGDTVHFTAEFLDSTDNFTIPPAPNLQVTYKNKTGTNNVETIPLQLILANPAVFACYWGSSSADPCVATVRVTNTGGTALASYSEQFRIIQEFR